MDSFSTKGCVKNTLKRLLHILSGFCFKTKEVQQTVDECDGVI